MKKVLQFAGMISLALAAVAFVLMMVTPAVIQPIIGDTQTVYAGTTAIFGKTEKGILVDVVTKPSVLALIGWILLLAGLIVVFLAVLLPLLKVKALERFSGVMNLVALCCFVLAGVFMFFVVPTFYAANEWEIAKNTQIGAGWVIGGIIAIVAGAFAILPAAADFMGKKKGKRK